MLKWKRLMKIALSTSILLTQGVPLPYLAYAMEEASRVPVNGEVKFSWTTADQVSVGATFNPYEGLQAIDADGDNVAVLTQVEGNVDTSREGVYSLSYSIENVDGQTFTMTRQIEVVAADSVRDAEGVNESEDSNEQKTQPNTTESNSSSGATEEKLPNDETGQEPSSPLLNEVEWSLYDRSSQQPLIQFSVDVESGQYVAKFVEDLKALLMDADEETFNQELLKLRIVSAKQVEKFAVTLTVRDLLGETEVLNSLNELPYEMGDQLSLIPMAHEKTILVIHGITDGDISKEQEDYSDGVEVEDYIRNVRFVIHETGLSTLYNEAPVIEGINDIAVPNFESFDPQEGVTVKDDHDDNLLSQLVSTIEPVDANTQKVTYQVTDSWGRTTKATRHVTQDPSLEQLSNPFTVEQSTTTTSIANNTITVRGIDYTGIGDQRFKITFDARTKKIFVTEADNRTMNSRVEGDYFKLVLYNSKGEVKKSITLTGKDRANSKTLNELIVQGWRYSIGDMISLWHYEPEQKISIEGSIIHDSSQSETENESKVLDFTQNVSADMLRYHRFELTAEGLKLVTNGAPTIIVQGDQEDLTVKRGEKVDILKDLYISDDHDKDKLDIKVSDYSTTTLGTQEVTITVTDTWGESTVQTRNLIVEPKNDIDGMAVNVQNKLGQTIFTLGFDELTKKLTVTNQSDQSIDSDNNSDVLIIRIYSKTGKTKRTIRIKGTDAGNSAVIEALKKYTYSKDDYISIVPVDSSIISIKGNITNQSGDVNILRELDDLDKLVNARFQLKSDGTVIYNYNHAPIFSGVEAKIITRGEVFEPLDGVTVTDKEDGIIGNSKVIVKYDQAALNILGETTVTYSVTDSWGRTTTVEREITVVAPNKLEYYQFHLLDGEDALVSIAFDKIRNKLFVSDYIPNEYIEGNESDDIFKLTLVGNNHEEKGSVSLKYGQTIDDSFISELEQLRPETGDYIKLWSPDHERVISSYQKDLLEINTFDSEERLTHTRFEVLVDSLNMVYNKAPKIIGADDVNVVFGNGFENMNGVTVEDEEELISEVKVNGEVDTNQLGAQKLTYTVTDSYGREHTIERTVTVVPVYTTNEVQYTDENNQYLISIGINESATGFTGTITDLSTSEAPVSRETIDQDENLDTPNETLFKFTVYNANGEVVEVLEITEQTTINESLFDELKALNVRPGYRFSVEARDLTKLKITGELEKDNQLNTIDYSQLTTDNQDAVENVRFELTDNIVKAIYNEAPVITIEPTPSDSDDSTDSESNSATLNADQLPDTSDQSTLIVRNKALTKEAYNLLEGVTVRDDKDDLTITVEDVQVDDRMLVDDLTQSVATIGQTYTVTYQVTDSWGRQSDPVTRRVQIKSAMDDVKITFLHAAVGLKPSITNKAATLSFNMKTGKISVERQNLHFKYSHDIQYGAFSITKPTGNSPTFKYILGGDNTYDQNTEFSDANMSNKVDEFKSALEQQTINYGDKIKIKIAQSPFVYINGTVQNAQEDYSKGANLGAVLENSYFVITPEGLKQEYNGIKVHETFSQLTWLNGVAGTQSVNLKLNTSDSNNLRFEVDTFDEEPLDTLYQDDLFKFQISKNGGQEGTYTIRAREYPTRIRELFESKIGVINPGDYMRISDLVDRRLSNLKFYNLLDGLHFPEKVDYSGVITNRDYFDYVRFYFTTQGILPVYNAGPVFVGADETDIIVGTQFNARDGVTVIDEIDGSIEEYTVSTETINTSQVGTQMITYTATDSWGRRTEHTRTVNVRPKLFNNKIQVFGANDTDQPAFEIIFDNQKVSESQETLRNTATSQRLGGLEVKSYSSESLDLSLATQEVFKIWVVSENNETKCQVTLLGRDAANSEKLDALKEIDYNEGDVIKVWRHPGLNTDGTSRIETLKITGTVASNSNSKTLGDYSNGFEELDQMNNTVFTISDSGLTAEYNAAPQFKGLQDKTLYYGESFNPLDNVTVADDKDTNLVLTSDNVKTDFMANRIGNYTATYTVTDSWGRATSQTITIKVLSKVVQNTLEVYSDESTKAFTIGFNEAANRLILTANSTKTANSIDSSLEMTLIVYDRFGNKKSDISITHEDTETTVTEKLNQLTKITITNNDMIAVSHNNPKLIRINGDVVNNTHNYQNGFSSTDAMKEVRFQVTNNGLTEIKAVEYTIEIQNPVTLLVIKRGETNNLHEGVTVNHPNETILLEQIDVDNFDINKIGYQFITYKATDSWGTTVTARRLVKVEAKNDLEKYNVHLMDTSGWFKKLTIGFDMVEMKLTAEIPSFMLSPILGTLPQDETVFELNVYNQNHELQKSFKLTASDLSDSSEVITKIQDESIEYGYFIEVRAYNYDKGLKFKGNITMESEDEDGEESEENHHQKTDFNDISKQDFITNARFELTEQGLVALYNEAPSIEGVEEQEIYIGEEQDFREKLEVSDDHDDLSYEDIEVTSGHFDFYEPGEYDVTYTLTDSWGRSSTQSSKVWVLSELQRNVITLKSKNSLEEVPESRSDEGSNEDSDNNLNWMMKLGFDSKTNCLDLQFNDGNTEQLDSTQPDEMVMRLTIFDEEGQEISCVEFEGQDTVTTIKTKLQSYIDNYQYTYGHSINIDILDQQTNQITIENVTLLGDDIPESSYQENSLTSKDYFENVRFSLDVYGLQAIYNHAPKLVNQGEEHLQYIKSLDVADYDLLANITITDDYDELDETNIEVLYNANQEEGSSKESFNPKDPKNLHLGDNTVTLIGVDSWGRQSEPLQLTLTLETAMNDIEVILDQVDLKHNQDGGSGTVAMSIKFNMNEKKIYATAGSSTTFKPNYRAYTFEVLNQDNNRIYAGLYGTKHDSTQFYPQYEIGGDVNVDIRTNNTSEAARDLSSFFANGTIEYGYKIKIQSVQAPYVKIKGEVIDAQEDYEQGASICDILNSSTFVITEEGLVQEYEAPKVSEEKVSKITWYSGVAGLKQFDLVYDAKNNTLSVETIEGEKEPLDTLYLNPKLMTFSIHVYQRDGTLKFEREFNSREYARDVKAYIDQQLQTHTLNYGDYIEIQLPERRRANMRIYGALDQSGSSNPIDYTMEVPDISAFNDARFYLTETGLALDYNEAPVFTGIEDTVLFAGENSINLRDGIEVKDDNTPDIEYKITANPNVTVENYETINVLEDIYSTNSVGAQEIYYVAKDSRDRITIEPRFIWVYARSQITVPDQSKLIVQEADPRLRTENDVYKYLIDMVLVTDEEDDAIAGEVGQGIKVTKENIETNLNPMVPGEYNVTYTVTDSDGNESTKTFTITVVRSINVSVPRNNIPFQVVTNLLGDDTEGKEFISGTIKIKNNYVTDVNVSVKSLTVNDEQSSTRNGTFELVAPNSIADWTTLAEDETMSKMALGIYAKSGFSPNSPVKECPIWLTTNMKGKLIGTIPGRELDGSDPKEAVLGFTAKYGKNFTSGKHRMKFTMVLEFD